MKLVDPKEATVPAAAQEEVSSNEEHVKKLSQYLQEQAIVFQQIASTISDSLYLKIKGKLTCQGTSSWVASIRT